MMNNIIIIRRYSIRKKSKIKKIANIRRPSLIVISVYYCSTLINPNVKGVDLQIYIDHKKKRKIRRRRKMKEQYTIDSIFVNNLTEDYLQ